MNVVHEIACGIDVHKRSLTACLLSSGAPGKTAKQTRTFSTMTYGLEGLLGVALPGGMSPCRHREYGRLLEARHNVLEAAGVEVILVNAQHVKNVPGRKTDVKDAEWIADLLRHGLPRELRAATRDPRPSCALTRYRTTLVRQRADECNRIQKLLETCNIKLASVATDVLGVSGRSILQVLWQGVDDPATLAKMAKGRLAGPRSLNWSSARGQFTPGGSGCSGST